LAVNNPSRPRVFPGWNGNLQDTEGLSVVGTNGRALIEPNHRRKGQDQTVREKNVRPVEIIDDIRNVTADGGALVSNEITTLVTSDVTDIGDALDLCGRETEEIDREVGILL
jgi:hypothetical protein